MKKYLFALIAFSFIACASCQENIDVANEKEAIKNVIKEEIECFAAQDIKEAEYFKKVDYLRIIYNDGNSHEQTVGWDSLYANVKKIVEFDRSGASDLKFECRDFHIKVYDDIAWAVYYVNGSGEWKGEPWESSSTKVTFLEKVDGDWKIVLVSQTGLDPCENDEDEE
jgi:hypothetical protein